MNGNRRSMTLSAARAAILFGVLALVGCRTSDVDRCPDDGKREIGETLYFGTSIPSGGAVSAEQWETFVAREITPRFPDGLTSWRANGQWLGANGEIAHEESYVLYVVHPDTPERDEAIRAIVDRYRTEFHQEAVLRVRSSVCVSF